VDRTDVDAPSPQLAVDSTTVYTAVGSST
jgi:hypothetical protein